METSLALWLSHTPLIKNSPQGRAVLHEQPALAAGSEDAASSAWPQGGKGRAGNIMSIFLPSALAMGTSTPTIGLETLSL